MRHGGIDNLLRPENMTSEELRERASKGGKASAKARRERKAMRETLELLLSMPIDSKKAADIESIRGFKGLKGKNVTVQDAILIAQAQKAMKGDMNAAAFIRDTIGEKPDSKVNVDMNVPVLFEGEDELDD